MSPTDDRSDLPPEQDAVRRLLAEARHDEPVPPAVAARLDAVLADLSAERRSTQPSEQPRPAVVDRGVVDLAARRRRRFTTGLLAAAAVVVAGVGLGQVVGVGGSDFGTASDESAAGGSSREFGAQESDGGGSDSAAQPEAAEEAPSADRKQNAGGFSISSDSLRRDLRAALRSVPSSTLAYDGACTPVGSAQDPGTLVPVLLDDTPALALFRLEDGDRQRVDVYPCGSPVPERTVTLRVR